MAYNFTNKVVLVTGASAGIGESIAIQFAKCGAKLAITGRNEKNLQEVAKKCENENKLKTLMIVADLATDDGCERTAQETMKHYGRLDVLINNAGVGARTNIMTTDMKTFDEVFNLDVRGVYNLTRLLVPALIKSQGNIINISSIAGTTVHVGSLPYGMAKAALDHFTRLTALELAPKGVRVNTIRPGITVSKFLFRISDITEEQYGDWLKRAEASIPMGRACVGDDIGRAALFLAAPSSRLLTGAILPVDGAARFGDMSHLLAKTAK